MRWRAPLSLTTIVIITSLFTFLLSRCAATASSILIELTRSPYTSTKSPVTTPWVYTSRNASPGENVSLAVKIGTILSPEPSAFHLLFLCVV